MQPIIGLIMFLFLMLPPVANLLESIMIFHMHMQMPLIAISGFLMAPFFMEKFPKFFAKWNERGIPGIILFTLVMTYWSIPRAMDDALTMYSVELFKCISLAFLAGVPLRASWMKLTDFWKNAVFVFFTLQYGLMGLIYLMSDSQLCNNYLQSQHITLGWGFLTVAIALLIYLIQLVIIDPSDYE